MCLILLSWRAHPPYRLVVAANRDEFHARPTVAADFWSDRRSILAGRDLEAGGTWMGVTRDGRFAALTNFRRMPLVKEGAPSRGRLSAAFLESAIEPREYLETLRSVKDDYAGFSIFAGAGRSLCYFSNVGDEVLELTPGVYGLSNHLLDTSWPKVDRGKARLSEILESGRGDCVAALFDVLSDRSIARDEHLPDTGVGLERERMLSPMFIAGDVYGTRSSTVVTITDDGHVEFEERTFAPDTSLQHVARFEFEIE